MRSRSCSALAYGGVMPLYATLVREYFGARIMGTVFGAVTWPRRASAWRSARSPAAGCSTHSAAMVWLYIGSFGIGLGAMAVALTFKPVPRAGPLRIQPA